MIGDAALVAAGGGCRIAVIPAYAVGSPCHRKRIVVVAACGERGRRRHAARAKEGVAAGNDQSDGRAGEAQAKDIPASILAVSDISTRERRGCGQNLGLCR